MRSRSLVCGTCVGIGLQHLNLAATHFDWVIIDEGARSSPAIAMQVGSRILLVGDHSQLRPTYEDEHKKAIAQSLGIPANSAEFQRVMRSDFERVFESPYGRAARATLKTQYRMLPPIGDLVSEIFYDNELKNGERPSPEYFAQRPQAACLTLSLGWTPERLAVRPLIAVVKASQTALRPTQSSSFCRRSKLMKTSAREWLEKWQSPKNLLLASSACTVSNASWSAKDSQRNHGLRTSADLSK